MKNVMLVLATFVTLSLSAQTITETEALWNAQKFLQTSNEKNAKLKSQSAPDLSLVKKGYAQGSETPAYYVFSEEDSDGGFVIVSGDSRTSHSILGYSTTGSFSTDNMPDNIQMWLGDYAEQVDAIRANAAINEGTGMQDAVGNVVVAPLITTQWNQDEPFNEKCPELNETRSPVGCLAVAAGQIMNYYKWPKQGQGYKEYKWNNSFIEKDFSESKYDYDHLDVAQFLYDVAVGFETNFMEDESSASIINAGKSLINNFGYDKGVEIHHRDQTLISSSSSQGWSVNLPGWSDDDWDNMIRAELDAKRPVLWGGGKNSRSHEFICDGYDDAGYFHFNWGWGGYCDGWYVTSSLNPEYDNTSYNYKTVVLLNLKPDEGNDQWLGSYGNEKFIWGFCDSVYVMYCMENDSTHEKFYAPPKKKELTSGSTVYAKDLDWLPEFSNGTIVPDGTYRKYEVYTIPGTDKYTPVQYGYGEDQGDSYETFKWVDVYNGVWTETSSRSFSIKKDDVEARYYIINDDEVKITSLTTSVDSPKIDEMVSYRGKKYKVTEIEFSLGTRTPQFPSTIKKMTTSIDASMKVELPDDLEELDLLYQGTQLTLPSSLKTLKLSLYQGTELILPSSLERISILTAPELTELIIPANVCQLPDPDEGDNSSLQVQNLKSVVFEEGCKVKKIPYNTFYQCARLSNVVLSEGLETIGKDAFYGCGSLKELQLPKSVIKIEENAFSNCTNLETFLIADDAQLEEIDKNAFYGCGKLKHINFPASVKVMNDPFSSAGLVEADLSKTHLVDVNFASSSLTSVILPDGVKTITLLGTGKTQSIMIPYGVETIENLNGPSLVSVTLPSSLTMISDATFAAGANVICEASTPPAGCGLTCTTRQGGKSYRDINIYIPMGTSSAYEKFTYSPPRVRSEYYYFSPLIEMVKCDSITNVVLGEDGLTIMGSSKAEEEVKIPASVNTSDGTLAVNSIGDYAFNGNANLRVVDIPASIGSRTAVKPRPSNSTASLRAAYASGIGSYAFAYCPNLEKVIVHWENPLEISADVFEGVDLSKLTLCVPVNAVSAYQSANVWKEFGEICGDESLQDIEDVSVSTREQDNVMYNLYGQKVDENYKGVVILGGKKMLIIR